MAVLGIGACFPLALLFELYYHNWCPMNSYLATHTRTICRRLYEFLVMDTQTHEWEGETGRHPKMWADFGTLLAIMRKTHIMPWDPDSDWVRFVAF
jgi:hypothetical protein